MGGRILDYPAKDILNRGKALGRVEGHSAGLAEGIQTGRSEGVANLIRSLKKFGGTKDQIVAEIIEKYKLSKQEAEAKVAECWI